MRMQSPLFVVKNHRTAVIVMIMAELVFLVCLIYTPIIYDKMEIGVFKFALGYGFLVLFFFALLHTLLFRTQTIFIYPEYLQIKSAVASKFIQWKEVASIHFSERELEYKVLNTYSPALVLTMKDENRYLIWCSQRRKSMACRYLSTVIELKDGRVSLNNK